MKAYLKNAQHIIEDVQIPMKNVIWVIFDWDHQKPVIYGDDDSIWVFYIEAGMAGTHYSGGKIYMFRDGRYSVLNINELEIDDDQTRFWVNPSEALTTTLPTANIKDPLKTNLNKLMKEHGLMKEFIRIARSMHVM